MPDPRPVRMTAAQHHALATVHPDGRLHVTDRRTTNALVRRGWAIQQRKRKKVWWTITEAGAQAYLNSPTIVAHRARPRWPSHWEWRREAQNRYIADEHEIIRPHRGLLWRVHCPARDPDDAIGYRDSLADAVDLLVHHYYGVREGCPVTRRQPGGEQRDD